MSTHDSVPTIRERETRSLFWRVVIGLPIVLVVLSFVAVFVPAVLLLSLIAATLGLAFITFLIFISIPLHLVLRALGRRGFVRRQGGFVSYDVSSAGFRRARPFGS